VSTWNDLSTSIAKQGASAYYILSKGFSTPLKKFEYITIDEGFTVTIDGGGAILDGRGTSSFFGIGGTLIIKGVTLQNGHEGNEGAALVGGGGSATFSSCSFVKNTAGAPGGNGGAVNVLTIGGSATFLSCSFVKNTVDGGFHGGAVEVGGGSVLFVDCSFEADGSGKISKDNGIHIYDNGAGGASVTFGCPTGTTGADVSIKPGSDLGTSQLPPAKQIVSCH
jgi:hypothetical protein